MRLYGELAAEYNGIFPSSPEKVRFIEKYLKNGKSQRLLDIGCASGEFVRQLSSTKREITGIDIDPLMIEEANARYSALPEMKVKFYQADMCLFLSVSETEHYDLISCLGNTVVYIDSEPELKKFLSTANEALRTKGIMIIQILNYSNPQIAPGFIFSAVETDRIEFNREYVKLKDSEKLGFKTAVKKKSTGETDTDLHRHYPFLSSRISEIAKESGFKDSHIYGGYDGKEADVSDFFHLIVLEK